MALIKKKKTKKGSARFRAFALIDQLLAKPSNIKKLEKAFQAAFNEDPVLFYKLFIRPTAEKELVIEPGADGEPAKVRVVFTDENKDDQEES